MMIWFLFQLAFLIAGPAWLQTTVNGSVETGLSAKKRATCSSGNQHNATETFQMLICGHSKTWAVQSVSNGPRVALKSRPGDAIQYVTPNGSDSNDGRSLGTAKLTWTGACEALPGGSASPPTCGVGTIYYTDGISANPVAWAGIWLFGPNDPGYPGGVSGWHRISGPIRTTCIGSNGAAVTNNGSAVCLIGGGSAADNNHPVVWLSGVAAVEFDGLKAGGTGRQVQLSVCSNGLNDGTCGAADIKFDRVVTGMGNAAVGLGPSWLIGDNSFWIFVNDYNISGNANNSPTADNYAAVLMTDNSRNAGLVEFTNGGFNTGGIKYYAGSGAGAYLLVNGMTTTENNLEAAVWVLGGNQSVSTIVVQNAGIADCNTSVAHCYVIRNDASSVVHASHISGPTAGFIAMDDIQNIFPDSTKNVLGPMQYNPNEPIEVERTQAGNIPKQFGLVTVPAVNLATGAVDASVCPTCIVTTEIADPTESGTGAIRVSDTGPRSESIKFVLSGAGGAVQGDSYVVGLWTRSFTGNGYNRGSAFQFALSSGGDQCNNNSFGGGSLIPGELTATENGWTHYIAVCKLTTYSPGDVPNFYLLTGNQATVEAFAPVLIVLHGLNDEEVWNTALNLGSWTSACSAGQTCDMTGPVPHMNTTQTWPQTQKFNAFATATNCAVNSASPATCGSAASGVFVVPALTNNYTVNTTAVTSNSRIFLQPTSDDTGIPSSPACTALAVPLVIMVSSRSPGTSFTVSIPSTTGTTCFYYWIVN